VVFVWRSLTYRNPIVELRAFANRNFSIGVAMTAVSGASLFGGTFLLPQFLGRVRHYSASEVGTTMVISGLSMFITGPIAGRLVRKTDPRVPMFIGFILAGWGMYMAHGVTKDWGFWEFAGVQACRGVGVMIAMIATQQITMSTLPQHMVKNASGLVNLSRNTGGAMGLAMLATSITQQTALYYNSLSSSVTSGSAEAQGMMTGLGRPHGSAGRERSRRRGPQGVLGLSAATGDGDGVRRQLHPAGHRLLRRRRRLAAGQARQERPAAAFGRALMPRIPGQIDVAKTEAILDAAVEVIGERGLSAPMEEIARRAGVSKQTVYNHYGSKAELVRALMARRVAQITAPLREPSAVDIRARRWRPMPARCWKR
jgi:hypothetical protein